MTSGLLPPKTVWIIGMIFIALRFGAGLAVYGQSTPFEELSVPASSELVTLQKDYKGLQFRFYLVVVVALGSVGGLVYVVSRYNQSLLKTKELMRTNEAISKELLEKKAAEEERVKRELNEKKEYLTGFAIEISRKHKLIEEVFTRLQEIRKAKDKNPGLEELLKYLRDQRNVESLLEEVELVNSDFYTKLNHLYPDLSAKERRMAALVRLNLSNKEIAIIKNITPASTKVLRHRLGKKLGVTGGESLYNFLRNL